MPPEQDLYVLGNIIGFTGKPLDYPTVYFLSDTHYGHITQKHPTIANVGREPACDKSKYSYYPRATRNNPRHDCVYDDDTVHLYEYDAATHMRHCSRNVLDLGIAEVIDLLAAAIRANPGIKPHSIDWQTFGEIANKHGLVVPRDPGGRRYSV
jgi:hypothetical protein